MFSDSSYYSERTNIVVFATVSSFEVGRLTGYGYEAALQSGKCAEVYEASILVCFVIAWNGNEDIPCSPEILELLCPLQMFCMKVTCFS